MTVEVKGTAVTALVDYVLSTQGAQGLEKLLERLPEESRNLLRGKVLASGWYPFVPAFVTPTRVVCELFHGGDPSGAWQIGRFSADSALKGVYKALLIFISPRTVAERGPGILTSYYRPMDAQVKQIADTRYAVVITGMTERSPYFDHRVAGFIERALEMAGAKELGVEMVATAAQGSKTTEIHFVWK